MDERVRQLNEFGADKVPGLFGFEIERVGAEGARGRLTITPALVAGTGYVWAPVVIGVADILCAYAMDDHLPEGASFTTVEVKANFLSSARVGDVVVGESRPVHIGRTTHVCHRDQRKHRSSDGSVPQHPARAATPLTDAAGGHDLFRPPGCPAG